MIVSASRRCDIPAHYLRWLMARIEAGYCLVRNPFDARSSRRVSLRPEDMDCLVLWTRDPRPLSSAADYLERLGIRSLVHVTLTGYPRPLEPGAPPLDAVLDAFVRLAARIGPERVIWRYDPILCAIGLDVDWHLGNFARLAARLEGFSRRVVLSLIDEYAGTRARIQRAGFAEPRFASPRGARLRAGSSEPELGFADDSESAAAGAGDGEAASARLPPEPYRRLLVELARIARSRGMRPLSCAEPFDLAPLGIEAGACIDAALLGRLFGLDLPAARDRGQRSECRCAPSVDIGVYGACPAGCVYCYANRGAGRLLDPRPEDEGLQPTAAPS